MVLELTRNMDEVLEKLEMLTEKPKYKSKKQLNTALKHKRLNFNLSRP